MSGRPSPAGAAEVIALVRNIGALRQEAVELEKSVAQLRRVIDRRQTLEHDLYEALRSMDVESPGNHGWEGRMSWFIAEIVEQASRDQGESVES